MAKATVLFGVAVIGCVILSFNASDVLNCTGERRADGQFDFNISYSARKDGHDCETQWLIDQKLAGLYEANGHSQFTLPITMATAKTVTLQTCPENLECLLICPSENIHERQVCSCDVTLTAIQSEFFPDWRCGVGIGVVVFVIVIIGSVIFLLYKKCEKKSTKYRPPQVPTSP